MHRWKRSLDVYSTNRLQHEQIFNSWSINFRRCVLPPTNHDEVDLQCPSRLLNIFEKISKGILNYRFVFQVTSHGSSIGYETAISANYTEYRELTIFRHTWRTLELHFKISISYRYFLFDCKLQPP